MKLIKRFFKLILLFLCFCLMLELLYVNYENKNILSSTYSTRRIYIGLCTYFDDVESYERMEGSSRLVLFLGEKSIKFKDENIVFECVQAGRGYSINDEAYYVILYNDGTLKYIKGDMIAYGPLIMDGIKILEEIQKYYEGKDVDHVYITALGSCKRGTVKLSDSEIEQLLEKLNIAEQFQNLYEDHFQRDTGIAFRGFYYNGKYYGPTTIKDGYERNAYDDVYNYIESLIGVESQ